MKDSADLLRAEIAKEEALLAQEKMSLQEMEKNAKRAEAERKRQMKNVCATISLEGWDLYNHSNLSLTLPPLGTPRLTPA